MSLRAPCGCGSTFGTIRRKAGQDVVRCAKCSAYQYCAPRTETGRGADVPDDEPVAEQGSLW